MSVDVEIWCAAGPDTERNRWLESFLAWEGKLPAVPRVGDIMCPFEDYDGKPVTEVAWRMETGSLVVWVWVKPDYDDQWTEALAKERP